MQYIVSSKNKRFRKLMCLSLLSFASLCARTEAQTADLVNTDDLVESPLSISLNTQTIVFGDNQSIINVGQFGLNNITNIVQSSNASNLSNVIQTGSNNVATITQIGEGNIVNLLQENNNNNFEILQDGFDNVANVNQLGEQAFIVRQIGNEMVINITQYQQ